MTESDLLASPPPPPLASTSSLPTPDPTPALPTAPLSKKAQKRLLRQEKWDADRPLRRAREREMRKSKEKEKKRLIREGVIEGREGEGMVKKRRLNKDGKDFKDGSKREEFGANLVIDLGFDDLMTEKEIRSMTSQLNFCYAANRATSRPIHLLFTSWNKRLRERMEGVGRGVCLKWKGVEWWEEGLEELWEEDPEAGVNLIDKEKKNEEEEEEKGSTKAEVEAQAEVQAEAEEKDAPTTKTPPPPITHGTLTSHPRLRVPKSSIIYLTGDSPNILTHLSPTSTYIIGGIVDHNRYKSLCLNKAIELGLQHAQLPIGDVMPELKSRKVVTVNQVVEICTRWTEGRDWERALREVMPTRKFEKEEGTEKGEEDDDEEGEGDGEGQDEGGLDEDTVDEEEKVEDKEAEKGSEENNKGSPMVSEDGGVVGGEEEGATV